MMWYGGHGGGWCTGMVNIPAMVLLWGAAVAGIVLAISFAARRTSEPPAPTRTGYPLRGGMVPARIASDEANNDDFYRRLM